MESSDGSENAANKNIWSMIQSRKIGSCSKCPDRQGSCRLANVVLNRYGARFAPPAGRKPAISGAMI
jgi:hypothetical protein